MRLILFVFSSAENGKKYQSFVDAITAYGGYELVLLSKEQAETQQINPEYQLIFCDYVSQNPKFLSLNNLSIEDLIEDINCMLS